MRTKLTEKQWDNWTKEDILLVGSYVPNAQNVKFLAKLLKRTEGGIKYVFYKLYLGSKDMQEIIDANEAANPQYELFMEARKELGLVVASRNHEGL